MKIRDLMTSPVIHIEKDESVSVAARTLEHYNIGALPVCGRDGRLCGLVTDRDIVIRCLAAEQRPDQTTVGQVMTGRVQTAAPDMEVSEAAKLMGTKQIRRLPVVENGKVCGMISLGDLATAWENSGADQALSQISSPFGGEKSF